MTDEEIMALIKRRRFQMLISSYIYYELDENIISDNEWMHRAQELRELQEKYPELSKKVEYYRKFKNWDGSSGYHLTYDKRLKTIANRVLDMVEKKRGEEQ